MPAQADPDLVLRAAKTTADLYGDAVVQLLRIVARRLARGIDRPGWAEEKLLELYDLRREALVVVDLLGAATPDAVEAAVEMGWKAGAGATNTAAVTALAADTVGMLDVVRPQVLRATQDIYRQVVAEAAGLPVTGAGTRLQGAQRALDRFAAQGVGGFTDRAGRRWALETYAEQAVRTAVGRAQVAGSLDRYQRGGHDLVIVSDAPQECKVCRRWEGRVLSISGNTPKGTRVTGGDGARFTVAGTVREAQSAGLHHPNCRHRLGRFVEGLTLRLTDTADPDGDRARQEQRRLERGVREWKRRSAAALTPEAAREADRRARAWQARLRAHVDAEGLIRRRERERLGPR